VSSEGSSEAAGRSLEKILEAIMVSQAGSKSNRGAQAAAGLLRWACGGEWVEWVVRGDRYRTPTAQTSRHGQQDTKP
jgi:hypothetical protein